MDYYFNFRIAKVINSIYFKKKNVVVRVPKILGTILCFEHLSLMKNFGSIEGSYDKFLSYELSRNLATYSDLCCAQRPRERFEIMIRDVTLSKYYTSCQSNYCSKKSNSAKSCQFLLLKHLTCRSCLLGYAIFKPNVQGVHCKQR